jgi:hypothetical protein
MSNRRSINAANYVGWHRSNSGYLTQCRYCGEWIYLKEDWWDGVWRPYESWHAGNCDENEWIRHQCSRSA